MGSRVYIRHHGSNGGFLHSHKHNYPGGSKQQQITLYPFKDENSWFVIKAPLPSGNNTSLPDYSVITPIKHGDIIRLEHQETEKRLHSHDVR